MRYPTFFFKPCPTCGRRLEILIDHLGKQIECPHCTSRFVAGQTPESNETATAVEQALLKAEEYLARFPKPARHIEHTIAGDQGRFR